MSTCPRTTVSPGSTQATPACTLTDNTTPSHSATKSRPAPTSYTSGAATAGAASTSSRTPCRRTPTKLKSGDAAARALSIRSASTADLGIPGRDAHLLQRALDGRDARTPAARQLDIHQPHATEERRQRRQTGDRPRQQRRAGTQPPRHCVPPAAGDDGARQREALAQTLDDRSAARIGVDEDRMPVRRGDGAKLRALGERPLQQALEHQPFHAQADVAVHGASPSPGSST